MVMNPMAESEKLPEQPSNGNESHHPTICITEDVAPISPSFEYAQCVVLAVNPSVCYHKIPFSKVRDTHKHGFISIDIMLNIVWICKVVVYFNTSIPSKARTWSISNKFGKSVSQSYAIYDFLGNSK